MLVYAGRIDSAGTTRDLDDLWAYRPGLTPMWEQIRPLELGPRSLHGQFMVLDSSLDRLIVIGGAEPTGNVRQWQLDLRLLIWQDMGTNSAPLSDGHGHDGYLGPAADEVIAVHGSPSDAGELWRFPLTGTELVRATLLRADAADGVVHLAWREPPGNAGFGMDIFRRPIGGELVGVTPGYIYPAPDGVVRFDDSGLPAGQTFDYGIREGDTFVGSVRVTVGSRQPGSPPGGAPNPPEVTLELRALPAFGTAPQVHVRLPDALPARLDTYDVLGRHLASVDVGALGKGEFNVPIAPGLSLHAGIYFAQLTRGTQRASVRIIVVP